VYVAGGVESMTRAPYAVGKTSPEWAFGNATMWDTTLGWRFPNPRLKEQVGQDSMGETAENVSEDLAAAGRPISREEQDRFALESHRRAVAAIESGKFAEEIVAVPVPQRNGGTVLVSRDEHPRPDTSLEALGRLRPAFRGQGSVTAGNSSGINDGAAALLVMSDRKASQLGLRPLARIVASAAAGVEPRTMGLGPIPATRKALLRAGLDVADLRLIVDRVHEFHWSSVRKKVSPSMDDFIDAAAPFAVKGRDAVQVFAEFGQVPPEWRPEPGQAYPVVVEVKDQRGRWTPAVAFEWWAPVRADLMTATVAHRNAAAGGPLL